MDARTRKGKIRTWLKLVWFSPNDFHVPFPKKTKYALYGFSANETVWFQFPKNDRREYISNYERTLSREINGEAKLILDHKLIFEDVFGPQIRVPRSYAWISEGRMCGRNGYHPEERSLTDFLKTVGSCVLKGVKGAGGKGTYVIRLTENGIETNGKPMTEEMLKQLFGRQKNAFLSEYIQQGTFANSLFSGSANTIRMVAGKRKGERETQIIGAVQRIGNEASKPVDNISSGALAAPIDLETGMLGPGIAAKSHRKGEVLVRQEIHPDTGEAIAGKIIPDWKGLKAQMTELTNRFPYLNLVAWDVLLTDEGPCILEGNASSGLMMFQTEHGVRNGIFGDIYRSYGIIR